VRRERELSELLPILNEAAAFECAPSSPSSLIVSLPLFVYPLDLGQRILPEAKEKVVLAINSHFLSWPSIGRADTLTLLPSRTQHQTSPRGESDGHVMTSDIRPSLLSPLSPVADAPRRSKDTRVLRVWPLIWRNSFRLSYLIPFRRVADLGGGEERMHTERIGWLGKWRRARWAGSSNVRFRRHSPFVAAVNCLFRPPTRVFSAAANVFQREDKTRVRAERPRRRRRRRRRGRRGRRGSRRSRNLEWRSRPAWSTRGMRACGNQPLSKAIRADDVSVNLMWPRGERRRRENISIKECKKKGFFLFKFVSEKF